MILKSLQWRLVSFFCLLAFCLIAPVSLYLNSSVEDKYYQDFVGRLNEGFESWSNRQPDPSAEQLRLELENNAFLFTANDEYRSYTIASNTGEIIASNDEFISADPTGASDQLMRSDNFVQAMTGVELNRQILEDVSDTWFFDFARPIGKYILYFRYYQEDWADMIEDFNRIILTSLFIAMAIALAVGYLLSKTITVPIGKLMTKAKSIATGDFDQLLEVKSNDEISRLTETFNSMATSLKNTLTEISSEKNKMETIFNYMTDGVIAFNLKGEVIHTNPAALSLLGGEEEDFDAYARALDIDYTLNDVLYFSSRATKEFTLTIKNNIIKVYFAVFTGDSSKPEGVIAVMHDITEEQRLENMRKDFVANVSHELRTPLTSIKSYTETLMDGGIEDAAIKDKFLSVINSETDRMTRLVKDLLQLSRLDNQQMKWIMEKISFAELVKTVCERQELEARLRDQKLKCYVLSEIPDIEADYDRIEQVILNIVSNAIKYTQVGGEINIYIGRTPNEVYVKVRDNGIGIPKQDLSRIFERFYRVDKARSREMGGTGLGLAIAREIIEAHSGTISISSHIGMGTEVVVRLPIKQPGKEQENDAARKLSDTASQEAL